MDGTPTQALLLVACAAVSACTLTGYDRSLDCRIGTAPHKLTVKVDHNWQLEEIVDRRGKKSKRYCVEPGDEVEWHVPSKTAFKIAFTGKSPFATVLPPSQDRRVKGTIKAGLSHGEEFEYSVTMPDQAALDPIIIIRTAQ